MNLAIASDHAGFKLKEFLKLKISSHKIIDLGTDSEESVDYPDFARKTSLKIISKEADFGVLICGTGIGVSIAANRNKEIRAALCFNTEMAILARKHNDANIICLGARFIDEVTALNSVLAFINTDFEAGRHLKRINKINEDL